ncbi:restriction endonuclease subunit S [Gordonia hongkongensis]|uniref:restriction endonuclease subunit S n=1 Tax=Gordonia hongkongensis TaxID=1701090 RepID=UPI0030CCE2F7
MNLSPEQSWIGDTPSSWTIAPLKYWITYNAEALPESTPPDTEIDYIEISDVSSTDGIRGSTRVVFGEAPSRARRIARAGDVLVSTVRTYLRAIGSIDGEAVIASTGFAVLRANSALSSGYLRYLCHSGPFVESVIANSTGVSYPAINASDLVRTPVAVPPTSEQTTIVAFLDRETAKIDALIDKQEQLIATLREDRAASITQAVTKGLDPNVEMKDSGVGWIGNIPTSWTLGKIKHGFSVVLGKMYQGSASSPNDVLCPHLKAGSLTSRLEVDTTDPMECWFSQDDLSNLSVRAGDLFVVEGGATYGRCAIVREDLPGWGFQKSLNRIRPLQNDDIRFVSYLIQTATDCGHVSILCGKATIPHFTAEKLANLEWPHPELGEQKKIADHLDTRCTRIDTLINKSTEMIETLREYRSALITDAVTGKIDVREVA